MGIPRMSSILLSAPRRLLHAASSLPYAESNGVGTFLSRKALGLITELQAKNIDQLNSSIKGTAPLQLNGFNQFLRNRIGEFYVVSVDGEDS